RDLRLRAGRRRNERDRRAFRTRRPHRRLVLFGFAQMGLMADPDTALVLFSGGQDSTVCLAWALQRFARVDTVGSDYRQRHRAELDVRAPLRRRIAALRPAWAQRLGEDHVVKVDALAAISDTALTREVAIEIADSGLPTTFVPGRNLV